MTSRTAVVVLGMHRSGTSALAGALGQLGLDLGDRLIAPAPDNDAGYWEDADVVALNDRLLGELQSCWEDPRPLPEGWSDGEIAARYVQEAVRLLQQRFDGRQQWAVKDPRMCRVLPVWMTAFAHAQIAARAIFVVRDPREVVASIVRRDRFLPAHAGALWSRYLAEAITAWQGQPRTIVTYAGLLADPVQCLERAGRALGVAWPRPPAEQREALARFLSPDRRHERSPASDAPVDTAARAYDACRALADGQGSWDALVACLHEAVSAADAGAAVAGLSGSIGRARLSLAASRELFVDTDRELGEAQRLSMAREGQLRELDAALGEAQRLSVAREGQLRELDAALGEAQAHAAAHLQQIRDLGEQLVRTEAALAEVTRLSLDRLGEIESLDARLVDAQRVMDELGQRVNELRQSDAHWREQSRIANERIAAIEASWSWRLTRPLRQIRGWFSRGDGR